MHYSFDPVKEIYLDVQKKIARANKFFMGNKECFVPLPVPTVRGENDIS